MSVTRDQVRQLVDQLPEDALAEAAEFLEWLRGEDELTPEEEARVKAAEARMDRGEGLEWREVKRELGL
jgi:hypothetical protein